MYLTQQPRVKICCISSIAEAQLAIACGADALGLVGHMPSGPGIISNRLIRKITKIIPSPIASFLLTSETNADDIIAHYKEAHTTTIQIVDALTDMDYGKIRIALPHVKLVQAIHVIDDKSVSEAIEISRYVDAILLDSDNPNLKVKELGGTGRTHNWELSRQIRSKIDKPVFLAGGLCCANVKEAIELVQPFGVDLCSGVRTNGRLDESKLRAFLKEVNK